MTSDKLTFDQERELSTLTAAANLHRTRGEWIEAEDKCRRALAIAPDDIVMHEMLADILQGVGKLDAALAEVKTAMGLAPGRASLETRYAKLVLEIGEREHNRLLAEEMLTNPAKRDIHAKNPILALFCAVLVPGLGQFYNGEIRKGAIILGTFLVFLFSFVLFPSHPRNPESMAGALSGISPMVQWLGSIAGIAYVYGLIDAVVRADLITKASKRQMPAELLPPSQPKPEEPTE